MRILNVEDLELVSGGSSNSTSSEDAKSGRDAMLGWVIGEIADQVGTYVDAYESGGFSGVAAATPAFDFLIDVTTTIGGSNKNTQQDNSGTSYCGACTDYS
ncbi:hypothetical protein [Acinetobacter sp.]|uniref:hypothetical protein n=1 Tax=Acinetobacter sp. TaxID=472 RepID=UPI00388F62C1